MRQAAPDARSRALDELRAACTLLLDPSVAPRCAVGHLDRAVAGLREAGLAEPAKRLADLDTAQLEGGRATRRLERSARAIKTDIAQSDGPKRGPRRELVAAAVLGATLLVGFFVADCTARAPTRWHAVYDSAGVHRVRRHRDLQFDWGLGGPDGLAIDDFTARFTSCLQIDRRQEVLFQVVADDSATLEIDGAVVIDISGPHPARRVASHRLTLEAGTHALRIEQTEIKDEAMIALLASFDGGPPAPIPADKLRFPPRPQDRSTPCDD